MAAVRTVRDLSEFIYRDDPPGYEETIADLWSSGASRPEWCFLLEDDDGPRARVGFRVAPTTTDPAWLGSLPPEELFAYGLRAPWGDRETGRLLVSEAASRLGDRVPEFVEVRFNAADHPDAREGADWAAAVGMTLFQEKIGFLWRDAGPVDVPARLEFQTVGEVGEPSYRAVMAACGDGTLDRNDRYYWTGCGPENWAAQMMVYLTATDADMWLLGFRNGEPVGYVAVVRDPELEATIGHIGVAPGHRGNGYVADLLAAGTAAAQKAGIGSILSDVDTLNAPMIRAMRQAGHLDGRHPWHVWVYRTHLSTLAG